MTAAIAESLQSLRDVSGVFGSFLLGRSGRLVCKDLPRMFDERVFEEVGPRVLRLEETLAGEGPSLDNVVLRYTDHKLYLRFLPTTVLGVITSAAVNAPTLKMAMALSARRIDSELGEERLSAAPVRRDTGFPSVGSAVPPPLWTDDSAPSLSPQTPRSAMPGGPPTLKSRRPSVPPPTQPTPSTPSKRGPMMYRGRRLG